MDLLTAEMEFMSGCVVIADLLDARIVTKKEYEKARKALRRGRITSQGALKRLPA
ncbi:hypothetical protein [Oribacterium sinus]|jgi:hypothetical protein